MENRAPLLIAVGLAGTLCAAQAQAATALHRIGKDLPGLSGSAQIAGCAPGAAGGPGPALVAPAVAAPMPTLSKSSALLGGKPSALDAMRAALAGGENRGFTVPLRIDAAAPGGFTCFGAPGRAAIAPTAFARTAVPALPQLVVALPSPVQRLVLPSVVPSVLPGSSRSSAPGEFLGSKRLRVAHTTFDADWARVDARALSPRAVRGILPAGRSDTATLLGGVNAWTNRHIRFAEDRQLYGQADYWADARTTLSKRAGDCEDIAILKMKLLAAAGVPRADMVLTVARDLARNADHAVLIVRDGTRFWLLDNATDAVLDASASNDYRPVFSYSEAGKWLHGY